MIETRVHKLATADKLGVARMSATGIATSFRGYELNPMVVSIGGGGAL